MQDDNVDDDGGEAASEIMLIQQYAKNFGIGFNSSAMDDPARKGKLMQLMAEALMGKRGPVTDADIDG